MTSPAADECGYMGLGVRGSEGMDQWVSGARGSGSVGDRNTPRSGAQTSLGSPGNFREI